MKHRMVLAGGGGFLGQVLARYFLDLGWEVVVLSRTPSATNRVGRFVGWDGKSLADWMREIDGASAVVNLTGRTVDCRYNAANRRLILDSRLDSTRVVGEAIVRCVSPPGVWLNSSTATIYRHTMGTAWDESGEIGSTPEAKDAFSVQVAKAWEDCFFEAVAPGTRKVALRTAMVLGRGRNSVFPVLCTLAGLGFGGRMGSGEQFVSWIHETDFCRSLGFLVQHEDIAGVVNVASPNPIPNRDLMHVVREVCGVRFGVPAPEWMLEIGAFFLRTETELVIKSRRVVPGRLKTAGFRFDFPEVKGAMRALRGQD